MTSVDLPRVWLTGFWGFSPEEDGVLGFTKKNDRARFLKDMGERQLVCVYGVVSPETAKSDERRLLGMLEVERTPIDSHSRMSPTSLRHAKEKGWQDKWRFAVPVRRAWRTNHNEHIDLLFPNSYDKAKGLFIASFGTWLTPEDAERIFEGIPFFETSVWNEPPVVSPPQSGKLVSLWKPSNAVLPGFGTHSTTTEDKLHYLYLATVKASPHVLAPRPLRSGESIWKIGITGNPELRLKALNVSFPPAAQVGWSFYRTSKFPSRKPAAEAETNFKQLAVNKVADASLGKEFFLLPKSIVDSIFDEVSLPTGVSLKLPSSKS